MPGAVAAGLKSLLMGDPAADGGMGTTLAAIGKTYRGSLAFDEEEGERNEQYSEENEDPEFVYQAKGRKSITFQIMDAGPDELVKLMGGTVTGSGAAKVWNEPIGAVNIEQSVKITATTGQVYSFPRCSVFAKFTGTLSKTTGLMVVEVRLTPLTPKKTGTSSRMVGQEA